MSSQRIFWLLTCAFGLLLTLPVLVQDGMFMDGVIYAAISKNMAQGTGSLWEPIYQQISNDYFHEHPPLVFWIQSWWFSILGNGIYTERCYTFFTSLLTVWAMVKCWRLFSAEETQRPLSWLPVFLLLTIPVMTWSFKNNMLENTMGIFTLFAVYFMAVGMRKGKNLLLLLGGGLIVPALLSKGVVGLFPLAIPFFYWLIYRKDNLGHVIIKSIFITLLPVLLFFLLFRFVPAAEENITAYLNQQLMPSLNGERVTTSNRFKILGLLIVELIIPVLLLLGFYLWDYFRARKINWEQKKAALFFMLIGISASIPLMASLKQRKFYLVPALPFFALGLSFLLAPFVFQWIQRLSSVGLQRIKWMALGLLFTTLIISVIKFGDYSRQENRLKDVRTISKVIPPGTPVTATDSNCRNWGLQAAMMRTGGITYSCKVKGKYILVNKSEDSSNLKKRGFRKMDLDLKVLKLLVKEE